VNPAINSRFGLLCPSCEKKLINPNQPWPQECATCGQRTHLKCLTRTFLWKADLDIEDDTLVGEVCRQCFMHAENNVRLIENIPHASGDQPISIYRRWKAQQPKTPKKAVVNLWGTHRVDPANFVPAVSKVLDIVHSSGPKVRWSVSLGAYNQIPMTNLASKEIMLPNYFDSPNALGQTHQEILDAMTGAAMHEAGHAAYDSAELIIEAQKRIKPGAYGSSWAAATCLNIVCDYNLERKVIERYPTFRHYFTECHRWSVRDTLPQIVQKLNEDGAEDKLNVRLAVLTWEMLGPGDLVNAGGMISDKLKFITQKCFDILKYAYTRGLLNTDAGKLKTARALYELARTITPKGYTPPAVVHVPAPQQPQQPQGPQPKIGTRDADDDDDSATSGNPAPGSGEQGQPSDEQGDASDADGSPEGPEGQVPGTPGDTGRAGEASQESGPPDATGDSEGPGELSEDPEAEPGSSDSEGTGDSAPDDDGTGTDPGGDGDAPGTGGEGDAGDSDSDPGAPDTGEAATQSSEASDGNDSGTGTVTASGDSGSAGGDPGQSLTQEGSSQGGESGSETPGPATQDPFTGNGDLEDPSNRRSNSKKDALDDLVDENKDELKTVRDDREGPLNYDYMNDPRHRKEAEDKSLRPDVEHPEIPDYMIDGLTPNHMERVRMLAPVISRLKKILRFRNADWGGQETGRRSGTLTRRHVARLSTLHSDKVFHKTRPDATPKVRIALLVDESHSMRDNKGQVDLYIGARNAATALTAALHGIKGIKLWVWGYSMQSGYVGATRTHIPSLRAYVDPTKGISPASLEVTPMFGGTPTGEAMDFAAETLTKNSAPDEKKVIFIITDGEWGGQISTASAVRKWTGKVTFVHIGLGNTVDKAIPYYVGPVNDVTLLPDLLSESVSEILH